MLTLDTTSSIQLEYLAEGAANIVYKIIPPAPSPSVTVDAEFEDYDFPPSEISAPRIHPGFDGKVVRLRKATASGATVQESFKHYEEQIVPLFPQERGLIEHVLFKPTQALLRVLNDQLKAMEFHATRPRKRHGVYLADDEEYGLLITDMSCSSPSDAACRCVEFKPKWLVQSPSAPNDAVRCRTCALRHLRRSQGHGTSSRINETDFCPLGLVSTEKAVVEENVERMFIIDSNVELTSKGNDGVRQCLNDFVYRNPLLEHLGKIQRDCDPLGVVNSNATSHTQALSVAMTLRDCTLFLKVSDASASRLKRHVDGHSRQVPLDGEGDIEARLGDLDFKSPDKGKWDYWRDLETRLIDEGWYTGREKAEVEQDELCILSKHL